MLQYTIQYNTVHYTVQYSTVTLHPDMGNTADVDKGM